MALDFPNTPTNGQIFTGPDGAVWVYDGVKWRAQAGVASISSGTGITATPNPITGTGTIALTVPVAVSSGGTGSTTAGAATSNNVGRNLIHNPLFNIAQRGNGPFSASGAYTADRWQLVTVLDTGINTSVFQANDTARAQIGDEAIRQALSVSFTGNAGAGAFTEIIQNIEDITRTAGKTVTLSFWATSPTGLKLGLYGYQSFGTGGSPSASAVLPISPNTVTLTSSWARYSVTFTVPSMAGKTLGTNSDNKLGLQFVMSSGATNFPAVGVQSGNIAIWGVQLEIGSTMTPLEKPDPQQDSAKCQRFYQRGQVAYQNYTPVAFNPYATAYFIQTMRAAPTVTTLANNCLNCTPGTWAALTPANQGITLTGTVPAAGAFSVNATFEASADL